VLSDRPASDDLDDRRRRAGRNQSLFREVNERIEDLGTASSFSDFVCECMDTTCDQHVALTIEEYEHVRSSPNRFLVVPGHEQPAVEDVVEGNARYVVVRKLGAGADVAARFDPRSRSVAPS
jgi:hypothetical protein